MDGAHCISATPNTKSRVVDWTGAPVLICAVEGIAIWLPTVNPLRKIIIVIFQIQKKEEERVIWVSIQAKEHRVYGKHCSWHFYSYFLF